MTFSNHHKIRILHVVGGMNRGGIETWLMHILRHIDIQQFQMDFLVHTEQTCAYDNEIRALGSKIISCVGTSKPWLYAQNFKRILRENDPYQIVHSHVHHFSGYILYLAYQAGVPICIAHSHVDSSALEANRAWLRRLYLVFTKYLIARHASVGLGCSHVANADLFGLNWRSDPRWQLLYYGINLAPFQKRIDPGKIRSELNIPVDAFVIGHVGRFEPQKNHRFLLEIFALIAKQEQQAYLLLVGEGVLRPSIDKQVREMGLADRVIFAGSRPDVPELMQGAMDVFLFPSQYEGLPLVLLEAQAAGLPCLISDVITQEVEVVKLLIKRLSLSHSVSQWAIELWGLRNVVSDQTNALELLATSPFTIETSLKKLENLYQTEFAKKILYEPEERLLQDICR